jgi:hypothetical protein
MDLPDKLAVVLRFVEEREEEFNRWAEQRGLGVHLRHGQLYPIATGRSHTARLLRGEQNGNH